MVHPDTNFLIAALQPGTPEESQLRQWLVSGEQLGLSTVAWAEFLCGPLASADQQLAETLFSSIEPLLSVDAARGAELFNLTGRRSRSLADCLIAAVALRCGAAVATANRDDFDPFVPYGLTLV